MKTSKNMLIFSAITIFFAISIITVQQVYATGCPTNFVSEHIKNAKTALQNGNNEEVLNQLQLAEEAIGMVSAE
ncbi:MAG: hypothetical protein M3227_01485 [Thermoproteota archaeon]|nr:hypothetical protein [Thermoproteota archaeon]